MTRILLALPAVLTLAACEPMPPVESPPLPPAEDACGASDLLGLLGQDRSALDGLALPEPVRIYGTGDALTMDFNPNRLNIEIGPEGTILAVTCG